MKKDTTTKNEELNGSIFDSGKTTIIQAKYLEFVPPCLVGGDENHKVFEHRIYVFSHLFNNRMYKRKRFNIGAIFIHNKAKKLTFIMAENTSLSTETMMGIALFMKKLELKEINFDFEKGEFINGKNGSI